MSIAGATADAIRPARDLRIRIVFLLKLLVFHQEYYLDARERQVGLANVRKLSELS